ncbi:UNVERIFIED_CONTAM: hypothetical protein Sradi_3806100 [Sesamum radiatum]|uniref:Uncharacterized protein n=1 Tax=Sesamum radiatum TaxID=300843 RepID=A0AAW2Q0T5_SESRA
MSSDTSAEELSPALLGAIQQIVVAALREHVSAMAPPWVATPSDTEAPEEEAGEEAPVPVPAVGRRREIPLPESQEVLPYWLARFEHLQKDLQELAINHYVRVEFNDCFHSNWIINAEQKRKHDNQDNA